MSNEYSERSVFLGFKAISNCHTHLKEGLKMSNPKDFEITVTAGPFITVNIKARDPCDCLALSGAIVETLRTMKKEPKAQVKP